jgi:hypothetical protein
MNQQLQQHAAAERYDAVLGIKAETVAPDTWKAIRRGGAKTAIYMPDAWCAKDPEFLAAARSVDAFFTPSNGLVGWYKRHGVANPHWVPEGCDPDAHNPVQPKPGEPMYPVGFVGTIEGIPEREAFLLELDRLLPGQLHLWGSYPGKLAGNRHHGRAEEHLGLSPDDALAWVTGHCLVTIDWQRNPEIERTYGARIYRTLSMEGCLLTNKILGIEQDFGPPGENLGVYVDAADCARQVEHYIQDAAARQAMAQRGRQLVRQRDTWDHRCHAILQAMGVTMERQLNPQFADVRVLVERGTY